MRTGVGTVPALMRTSTLPSESETLLTATDPPSTSRPPASVVGSSTTRRLGTPAPLLSRTWKITFEFSTKPDPRRKMTSGDADTKDTLDAVGAVSVSCRLAVTEVPVIDACTPSIASNAPQPASR
jgi:hypothetical protein